MNGLLLFDKPCGPGSFAVVSHCKRLLKPSKIGHAGTLDPAASGLLVIALGKATQFLPYLPLEPKVYEFTVQFGAQTDTLDSEGAVLITGASIPAQKDLQKVLPRFVGAIEQLPPIYSALKVDGERAYDLARRNETVVLKPRTIVIHQLIMNSFDTDTGVAACMVRCGGGTYVRALARDLAAACGTVGYAASIRRTAIGPFAVAQALPFDGDAVTMAQSIIPLGAAFASIPRLTLSAEQIRLCRHGHDVNVAADAAELAAAFSEAGEFIAIVKSVGQGIMHPQRVLAGE